MPSKIVKTTVNLDTLSFQRIREYGEERGCPSFSETLRDMARNLLPANNTQPKQRTSFKNGIIAKNRE